MAPIHRQVKRDSRQAQSETTDSGGPPTPLQRGPFGQGVLTIPQFLRAQASAPG